MCVIQQEMKHNLAITPVKSVCIKDGRRAYSFELLITVTSDLDEKFQISITSKRKEDLRITKNDILKFKGQTSTIEEVRGQTETCVTLQSDDGQAFIEVCSKKLMGIGYIRKGDFSEADLKDPPIKHLSKLATYEGQKVGRIRNREKPKKIISRVIPAKKIKSKIVTVG